MLLDVPASYKTPGPLSKDCWVWDQAVDKNGYGKVWFEGKTRSVHRLAFEAIYGYVPDVVMHRCDNPPCFNPFHLDDGSHSLNQIDCYLKKRRPIGSQIHWTKLTEDDVRAIRILLNAGRTCREIGRMYGVNHGTISNIKNGKKWRHVT